VPYREIDVSQDRQAGLEMVRRTGQQGVPVIAIDDQYIVGFDKPRIERALAVATARKPSLGASIADAAGVRLRREGVPERGAYVGRVRPGSAAARAGLASGDVIVELGGRPVATAADVETALAVHEPGSTLRLTYLRDGKLHAAETSLS
jgi:S1-C subfamily serine protease